MIKNLLNRNKIEIKILELVDDNGNATNSSQEILNNKYFSSIAENLKSKFSL